jgi:hypothetical protein
MSLPTRFTIDELMLEPAKVKPAPLAKFAHSCEMCRAEAPPGVVHGYFTEEGLRTHLFEVHGLAGKA